MANIRKYCKFTIVDKSKDKTFHRKIEGIEDSTDAYTELRDQTCQNEHLSISEFERRFEVEDTKVHVEFADKPWDDGDELRNDIEGLESVESAFYIPPTVGRYGPPAFQIDTEDELDSVRDDVKSYYDGLTVGSTRGSILVEISPTKYKNQSRE